MAIIFEKAFTIVIGNEGGFTANPDDPGNWTKGSRGSATCAGTNYGISAKTYPTIDIRNLTLASAQALYQRDYWNKNNCDKLPPGLALLMFDCAVNGGHPAIWLQAAVGAAQDGQVGQHTLDAATAAFANLIVVPLLSLNSKRAGLPTWLAYQVGKLSELQQASPKVGCADAAP